MSTPAAPAGQATPAVASPWHGLADSFVAGYSDTLGFVALYGLFTAHVTGNFVVLGSSLVHNQAGAALKLLAFPVFVLGVAASRRAALAAARRGRPLGAALHRAQALLMAAFLCSGVLAPDTPGPDSWQAIVTGMLGVLALSVQNARNRMDGTTPNTVMTGNVTQLVIDAVDLAHKPPPAEAARLKQRMRALGRQIGAFALGAAGGAFGYLWSGYWALVVPIALLLAVSARAPAAAPG